MHETGLSFSINPYTSGTQCEKYVHRFKFTLYIKCVHYNSMLFEISVTLMYNDLTSN